MCRLASRKRIASLHPASSREQTRKIQGVWIFPSLKRHILWGGAGVNFFRSRHCLNEISQNNLPYFAWIPHLLSKCLICFPDLPKQLSLVCTIWASWLPKLNLLPTNEHKWLGLFSYFLLLWTKNVNQHWDTDITITCWTVIITKLTSCWEILTNGQTLPATSWTHHGPRNL